MSNMTSLKERKELLQVRNKSSKTKEPIIIGKDILELLSSAMYIDPLTIYREYLQNSADSIDDGVKEGLLKNQEEGRVDINVDPLNRIVKIRDNGVGLSKKDFEKRMTAFGASKKRNTNARGFRGVGRLAGIAYCRELIFRTKSKEDSEVHQISWDCQILKSILMDSDYKGDLTDVVKDAVSISSNKADNFPEHFFEVELKFIVKHKKDNLLNPEIVEHYIAQIAPVPFSPSFSYAEKINEYLKDYISMANLNVYIDNHNSPVYRPHKDQFNISETIQDTFKGELECFSIPNYSGEVGAVGWILHHNYLGAIPPKTAIKGFRVRCGNIQVGDDNLLDEIFTETRFNSWTVAEVHVIDKKIKPNGRRDNFDQNIHLLNFTNHLNPIGRKISKNCRNSSILRNRIKEFEIEEGKILQKIPFLKQQSLPKEKNIEIRNNIKDSLQKLQKLTNSGIIQDEDKNRFLSRIKNVQQEMDFEFSSNNDPLESLPKQKKIIYKEVFGLVYEFSHNHLAAKTLIDKILSRLS